MKGQKVFISSKKLGLLLFTCLFTLIVILPVSRSFAANPQLTVDLASSTGSIRYGATGFLYGLGDEGIPSDNMLAALNPNSASQKPPNGLQHPNGDAFNIAPEFLRTGGKQIQIIMQDMYLNWPYDNLGITDYLAKVTTIANLVVAHPNRSQFVYVPFNEPDQIWYAGNVTALLNDWKTVYQKIRSIDSTAKIAGINFASYNNAAYTQFLTFAQANNCLPDMVTWHELGNSFFTDWYTHYNNYRSIETSLGITPRPININEYGRINTDIPIPGNLVQFITRFENSKVDANLAYWTTAGSLNDLVNGHNKATGGWWLYKWYGDLTGNTVTVTPPAVTGSLQGLAALDSTKKQARVIFGGAASNSTIINTDVVVKGFGSAAYFGTSVHATVWAIENSGQNASTGPVFKQEGDYTITSGQITVPVNSMNGGAAYHMIITPNMDLSAASSSTRYEAEYAKLAGSATVTYGSNTGYSGTSFVEGYGASSNASTSFVVTAASDGYYNVTLRYSAGATPTNRTTRIVLNGTQLKDVALTSTADWNTWASSTTRMFLTAGINRIAINAYTSDETDSINIDYIDVVATTGPITGYEAEASANTRAGAAVVTTDSAASGGSYVGYIGGGAANTLQFNNVNVTTAGLYRMVVTYANGELGAGAANYNSNIVDRYADISVNGGTTKKVFFRNTLGWAIYRTAVIDINLNAGNNTIKFSNSSPGFAPNIDKLQIAVPL